MTTIEIHIDELKSILASVYSRAVNSYFDLSDLVVEEIVDQILETKAKEKISKISLNDKPSFASAQPITLAPVNTSTTLYSPNTNFDTLSLALPNSSNYNNYCIAPSVLQASTVQTV